MLPVFKIFSDIMTVFIEIAYTKEQYASIILTCINFAKKRTVIICSVFLCCSLGFLELFTYFSSILTSRKMRLVNSQKIKAFQNISVPNCIAFSLMLTFYVCCQFYPELLNRKFQVRTQFLPRNIQKLGKILDVGKIIIF
jgi:hypothetical protein